MAGLPVGAKGGGRDRADFSVDADGVGHDRRSLLGRPRGDFLSIVDPPRQVADTVAVSEHVTGHFAVRVQSPGDYEAGVPGRQHVGHPVPDTGLRALVGDDPEAEASGQPGGCQL